MLVKFSRDIYFHSFSAVGGYEEMRGNLKDKFDFFDTSDTFGKNTWELAEGEMCRTALNLALQKGNISHSMLSLIIGGDLQNQCVATSLGLASFGVPFFGVYGACSTCTESLAMLAAFLELSGESFGAAVTSSHNSAAERQFRTPVEYGGQRNRCAQWTATAAGAFCLGIGGNKNSVRIKEAMAGRIVDGAIRDGANMGGAMAFAAFDTIMRYFNFTSRPITDFDCIVTGDLGEVGSAVLKDLFSKELPGAVGRHQDCGLLLYDNEIQDTHSGASGCGTSASVLASHFLPMLQNGDLKRILFLSTGALMSPSSIQQGQNIFGIAPLILLEGGVDLA